jgi:hypothetical protein
LNSIAVTPSAIEDWKPHEASPPAVAHERASWWITLLQGLLLLTTALWVTGAMWHPALLAGHSAWFDLLRMVEFDAALHHGEFLPAWSPDFYYGYGSPLFLFYAPLSYYLTEIPVLAGCAIPTALKLTQFLALLASGLAMYRLAATHLSRWAACLGAVLYMVAPYRFVDIYVRHALAEHCAFVWLPLIVWGTERFLSRGTHTGLITAALSTAGLILTHNIMALIGLPVCVVTGWLLSASTSLPHARRQRYRLGSRSLPLFAAAIPAFLGVGLAAFFWWPAMTGRHFVQAEQSLTGGYFDFHHHFVSAPQFISSDWGFGQDDTQERMSLQIGWPHLLAGLGALALLVCWFRAGKDDRPGLRWCLAGVLIMLGAVFFCSRWSQFIWEHLPLLKYVQFPWRFLGLLIFGAAICGAAVADRFVRMFAGRAWGPIICLAAMAAVLGTYIPYYSHARFIAVDARKRVVTPMSAEKVDALNRAKLLISIGYGVTRQEIRAVHETATSSDDFLPQAVIEKPTQPAAEIIITPGSHGPVTPAYLNDYRTEVEMPAAGTVQLLQFWFPGWQAIIDGIPTTTTATGPQAIVSCTVPAGHHTVEFRYDAYSQRRIGWLITLVTLVLGTFAILLGGKNAEDNQPRPNSPRIKEQLSPTPSDANLET